MSDKEQQQSVNGKRRASKAELELWRRAAISLDKLLADIEILIEANTTSTLGSALTKSRERSHFVIKNGDLYAPRDLLSLYDSRGQPHQSHAQHRAQSQQLKQQLTQANIKQLTIENE